jgi:hypothetical protein
MNQGNERTQIINQLIMMTELYGKQISQNALKLFADMLMPFDYEKIMSSLESYLGNPKNKFFPVPAQIIELMEPKINDDEEARRISATIIGCVSKHGYNNGPDARKEIGELGWDIILRLGGWVSFCTELSDNNVTSFQAQIRDLASVSLKSYQGARHALAEHFSFALPYDDDTKQKLEQLKEMKRHHAIERLCENDIEGLKKITSAIEKKETDVIGNQYEPGLVDIKKLIPVPVGFT